MKYTIKVNGRPVTKTVNYAVAKNILDWYEDNKHLLNINKIELIAEK